MLFILKDGIYINISFLFIFLFVLRFVICLCQSQFNNDTFINIIIIIIIQHNNNIFHRSESYSGVLACPIVQFQTIGLVLAYKNV